MNLTFFAYSVLISFDWVYFKSFRSLHFFCILLCVSWRSLCYIHVNLQLSKAIHGGHSWS